MAAPGAFTEAQAEERMAKARVIATIHASAPKVWDLVGDFGAIGKWLPGVTQCRSEGQGIGMLRRLSLANGGSVVERLEEMNDAERFYRYGMLEGSLPVSDYRASLWVRAAYDAPSSTVEWAGEFEPRGVPGTDAEMLMQSIYQAGLDNLRAMLEA